MQFISDSHQQITATTQRYGNTKRVHIHICKTDLLLIPATSQACRTSADLRTCLPTSNLQDEQKSLCICARSVLHCAGSGDSAKLESVQVTYLTFVTNLLGVTL